MMLPVKLLDEAELEGAKAIDWYEQREPGLGIAFRESVETSMSSIQSGPLTFPVVHGSEVRAAQVKRFPYTVFFTVQSDRILIFSIFHNSRNPIIWRGRIG